MRTAISPRCIAVVFATLITVGIPFSSAAAQVLRGLRAVWEAVCRLPLTTTSPTCGAAT